MLTIHQDGLLDVLAGMIIASFGMIPLLDGTGMNPGVRQVIYLSCYLLEIVGILLLKRAITLPRTGLVIMSREKKTKMSVIMLIINGLIFLLFAGAYLFKIPLWKLFGDYQLSIPLGLIFFILLSALAVMLRAGRYYVYALLVLITFVVSEHLSLKGVVTEHGIPLASFLSGGIIVLSGGIYLYRFLLKYKVEKE
jgi:hypothetical protein